ncbi:MAG: DUF5719 family protein [Nocardioidaceae bacterium]
MTWRAGVVGGLALAVSVSAVAYVDHQGTAEPAARHRSSTTAATTRATLSCPETSRAASSTTAFAVAPKHDGSTGGPASSLTIGALGKPSDTVASARRLGVPVVQELERHAGRPAMVVRASGNMAPGASAAQWSTYDGKKLSGLATSWCQATSDDWWFNGVDTSVGATSRLVVSNPTPATAVVDMQLFGPGGEVHPAGARGVAIAPGSRKVLDLTRFAPGRKALTVHVTASRGTVTSAVQTARLQGLTATGTEWIAPATPPARHVLVNAGFSGRGEQRLVITNPGDRQALVRVEVLGKRGAYTPTHFTDLQVPPGSVRVKDLTDVTKSRSAALRVSANVDISAATVSEAAGHPQDFAVSSASQPLDTPAVVPVIGQARLSLAFAASDVHGGKVTITTRSKEGKRIARESLELKGRATTVWEPKHQSKAAYVVVSVDVGSTIRAVANYSSAGGIASLPVLSGRWTVTVPAVEPGP